MKIQRRLLVFPIALASAVFGFAVAGAPKVAPAAPLKVEPLAYFTAHCARCHGVQGSNYADNFTKGKSDADLRKVLKDMADGPGAAPLDDQGLASQIAYHRAIDTQSPFLSWTSAKNGALAGEALNAEKLTATSQGTNIPVKVKDGKWQLTLPSSAKPEGVVLNAVSQGKKARLALAQSAISQTVP